MLIKQANLDDVLSGRKTQTVRLKQPRLQIGRTDAVQTSFRSPALGRIRVIAIRKGSLRGLTRTDIDREGFRGLPAADFEQTFAEINHFGPDTMTDDDWEQLRDTPLWIIEFEPAPSDE